MMLDRNKRRKIVATIKEAVQTFIRDNAYGMWIVPNGKILEVFNYQEHNDVANGFFLDINNPVVGGYNYSTDVVARHGWIRVILPTQKSRKNEVIVEVCKNYLSDEAKMAVLELLSSVDHPAYLSVVSYEDPINQVKAEHNSFSGDRRKVMAQLLEL